MADTPRVLLSIHPHLTVEYDVANHPANKCTFPATDANVADLEAQLTNLQKRSDAMTVLAST
jgi:hypothetical protein